MTEQLRSHTMPHRAQSYRSGPWPDAPDLAFAYLYFFRRVVVGLTFVGAIVAWVAQAPWLAAACVTIGIGEWLESSYYIGVLRWGQRRSPPLAAGHATG